jgi:hypothetical protein
MKTVTCGNCGRPFTTSSADDETTCNPCLIDLTTADQDDFSDIRPRTYTEG